MKARDFIVEYDRQKTKENIGKKLWLTATDPQIKDDRNVSTIDDLLTAFENTDPTNNKQYVRWIANHYNKREFRYEDLSRVAAALTKFQTYQRILPERDINKYKLLQLEDAIEKIESGISQNTSTNTDQLPEQTETVRYDVLYNGPLGWLVKPKTKKASQILGRQTKWCTAYTEKNCAFDDYNSLGSLYIWRGSDGKKYQFFFPALEKFGEDMPDFQFMDSSDRPIDSATLKMFRTQHPVLKRFFAHQEKDIAPFAFLSFHYAKDIIKDRWPEAESSIIKFLDIDDVIAYAQHVVRGRWPEAEERILKSNFVFIRDYLQIVLTNGGWLEAKNIFKRYPKLAAEYAAERLKIREHKIR